MPKGNNSGGKRSGSGRKPKRQLMASDAKPHDVMSISVKGLSTQQVAAVALLARGMKNRRIAKEIGVAEETISRWKSDPTFMQTLGQVQARILADPAAALDPMVSKAFGKLEEALEQDGDLKLGVDVAKDVLDRKYGKALVRQAVSSVKDVRVMIVSDKEANAELFIEKDEYVDGEFIEVEHD